MILKKDTKDKVTKKVTENQAKILKILKIIPILQ